MQTSVGDGVEEPLRGMQDRQEAVGPVGGIEVADVVARLQLHQCGDISGGRHPDRHLRRRAHDVTEQYIATDETGWWLRLC